MPIVPLQRSAKLRKILSGACLIGGLVVACGEESLEGRACPCLEGWSCCESTERCVQSASECPRVLRELTLLAGKPGGRGSADGIGSEARFDSPASIVGNGKLAYLVDGPAPDVPTGPSVRRGVRRISLETRAVEWLVDDLDAKHLALDGDPRGVLYVAEAERQRVRGLRPRGSRGVRPGALPASLNRPAAIAVLTDGELAIAESDENVVLIAR
jgi:hypothetical protein